ncbi:acyltransferase [Neobacillus sp. D3-1R]|uniref:acyltransferase n=1 Tax=Neobacillus sp. D3-1R TaxID=3445778 RepID=UPI003F9EDFE3
MQGREQIVYIDFLRIFAAFAVVMLHTSAPLLLKMGQGDTVQFLQGNLIDSATRWSVPIFFMISGALLLNSKRDFDLGFFLKKRFNKILIPFLFFSVFYFIVEHKGFALVPFLLDLANNKITVHLWFFYALIAVYLFSPVLILFVKQSNQKLNIFILIVWFLFCSLVPFLNGTFPTVFKINFFKPFGTYLGYFLLGYVLFRQSFSKKQQFLIYFLGALSYFITFYGTYIFTRRQDGQFFGMFYEYNSPNVLMMSIAIFVFFKYVVNFKMKNTSILTKISSLTFGIFLLHPYILKLMKSKSALLSLFNQNVLINIPLICLAIFIICLILSLIISWIPVLKKVI